MPFGSWKVSAYDAYAKKGPKKKFGAPTVARDPNAPITPPKFGAPTVAGAGGGAIGTSQSGLTAGGEKPKKFVASPYARDPNAPITPPKEEVSPYAPQLDTSIAEATAGKSIEEAQAAAREQAARDLANAEQTAIARGGGTDNPYSTLAGIAGKGEYVKALGNINQMGVENWFKQQQLKNQLLTEAENRFRADKPDEYARWAPIIAQQYGMGARVNADGSVTMPDGTTKTREELTPAQQQMNDQYLADMDVSPLEMTGATEEKEAKDLETFATTTMKGMDADLDWNDPGATEETALIKAIWAASKNGKKTLTKREVAALYAKYGENGQELPPQWRDRTETSPSGPRDVYATEYGDEPAW